MPQPTQYSPHSAFQVRRPSEPSRPHSAFSFLLLALAPFFLTACSSVRTTTTNRSAIEQALLSQAVEASVAQLSIPEITGKRYVLRKDYCYAVDNEYVLGAINRRLLEQGGLHVDDKESTSSQVDLIVYPMVGHSAVDDASCLIGLPDIPMAVPGVGAVTFPETAIYKHVSQTGRNRMSLFAKEKKTGRLVYASQPVSSQRKYERWVVLFLLHFRTTDLQSPY